MSTSILGTFFLAGSFRLPTSKPWATSAWKAFRNPEFLVGLNAVAAGAERADVGKARECSAAISGRATAKPTVAFGSGAVILWKHA